jgi:O-6-methylguanine DNA methyltransferase
MNDYDSSLAISSYENAITPEVSLTFEKFLKKHIKMPAGTKADHATRLLLSEIASQSNYGSALYEHAYLVFADSVKFVPQAILWAIPDPYDQEQITCRLQILSTNPANDYLWQKSIEFINREHSAAFCIRWLIRPENTEILKLFYNLNFQPQTGFSTLLPDYVSGRRIRYTGVIQYYHERLDRAVSFVGFKPGLIVIYGNRKSVLSISFWHTGTVASDKAADWTAGAIGLVDPEGCLISLDSHAISRLRTERSELLPEPVKMARDQINEYLEGNRKSFDLPLDLSKGSEFQQKVWEKILQIPFAFTATYEDLAREIVSDGQKPAHLARAIGAACSANPLPVVVPCHRVIGKDGKLTGFNGGLDVKEYLLNHEMLGL